MDDIRNELLNWRKAPRKKQVYAESKLFKKRKDVDDAAALATAQMGAVVVFAVADQAFRFLREEQSLRKQRETEKLHIEDLRVQARATAANFAALVLNGSGDEQSGWNSLFNEFARLIDGLVDSAREEHAEAESELGTITEIRSRLEMLCAAPQ